ncbi:hypothetical protein Tco_0830207, partial [Tanacetum coccineum]
MSPGKTSSPVLLFLVVALITAEDLDDAAEKAYRWIPGAIQVVIILETLEVQEKHQDQERGWTVWDTKGELLTFGERKLEIELGSFRALRVELELDSCSWVNFYLVFLFGFLNFGEVHVNLILFELVIAASEIDALDNSTTAAARNVEEHQTTNMSKEVTLYLLQIQYTMLI